jgi:hypothetical protein
MVIRISTWDEVLGLYDKLDVVLKDYDTLIIDTVNTCLGFMRTYLENKDMKLKTNTLQMYGKLKDEFDSFNRRVMSLGKDIIYIAHSAKEEAFGVKRIIPQIVGSTYDLVLTKSDMVGFMRIINGKRTLNFDPTEYNEGKNTAKVGLINLPDYNTESNFMETLTESIKHNINDMMEEQSKIMNQISEYKDMINTAENHNQLNDFVADIKDVKASMKAQLREMVAKRAKALNLVLDTKTKLFIPAPGTV